MARHCNKKVGQVEKDLERDNFMSSAQAVEYGLIDTVLERRTEMKEAEGDS
jgi:ATP-dependent Clp protease protease subunit